ncbi:putative transcription regulator mTERF family [Dioscorea sansibarensis]
MIRLITRNLSTIQTKNPRNPTTSSPNSIPLNSSSIVSYLIDSFGLSPEKALAAVKKLKSRCNLDIKSNNIKARRDPNAVPSFFASNGFTKDQISKIITKFPRILLCSPDRTLKPKIDFFLGAGFSRSDMARLMSDDVEILQASLNKRIIPFFDFLKTILYSDKEVIAALKQTPRLLHYHAEKRISPNIETLRGFGMPEHRIYTLSKAHTRILLCETDRFRRSIERVRDLGFKVSDYSFVVALQCVSWLSAATWEGKVAALKSFGLSEDQILSVFKKKPAVMIISKDKLKRNMSFFVSRVSWSPEYVVLEPRLLGFSLDKRLLPRTLTCEVLLSKGLISDKAFNYRVFLMNERRFFEKYVMRYQGEHPQVLEVYQATLKQQH